MLSKIVIYTDYDTRLLPQIFFWFFFCSPFLGWGGEEVLMFLVHVCGAAHFFCITEV